MSDVIDFPQEAAGASKGKPTIGEILEQAETPEQAFALVRTAYPGLMPHRVEAAVTEHCAKLRSDGARLMGEADALQRAKEIASRDTERTDETPLGESLRRLKAAGDQDAAAVLAQIDSPSRRAREFWLGRAAELDPYWMRTYRGYKVRQGARFSDPEDLINHYIKSLGKEAAIAELPDDLKTAFLAAEETQDFLNDFLP